MKIKFEGYYFGNSLLEDVYFHSHVDNNKIVSAVVVHPDYDDDYWKGLDRAKWLDKAKEWLQINLDAFGLERLVEESYVTKEGHGSDASVM